jgi:hypothetical protein
MAFGATFDAGSGNAEIFALAVVANFLFLDFNRYRPADFLQAARSRAAAFACFDISTGASVGDSEGVRRYEEQSNDCEMPGPFHARISAVTIAMSWFDALSVYVGCVGSISSAISSESGHPAKRIWEVPRTVSGRANWASSAPAQRVCCERH